MLRFGIRTARSKLRDYERPVKDVEMSLLELSDTLLQNILRLLDDVTFSQLSRTCKRLNELANSYSSWSYSLMGKRIEKLLFNAYKCRDQRAAQAIYESCCNAELLNMNLEIINERNAVRVWRALGELGGKLFSLLTTVSVCDTREIWPFCHVATKEIKYKLANETAVMVYYVSLCDEHSSLNNHTRITLTIERPESRKISIIFNSKPMGLLDSGIIPTTVADSGYGNAGNFCEIQNKTVLRPVFDLFEKELGISEDLITFEFFTRFLQSIDRNLYAGYNKREANDFMQNRPGLKELVLRTKRLQRKLQVEFLRAERERNHHISSAEIDFNELSQCLVKLAKSNGGQLKNIRLRTQCIRDILNDINCTSMQHDMQTLPSIIKNIDLGSIRSGWACINTNLFTIWKEFTLTLGRGKHFKATITWQEKRDRANEYSVANKEICLVLERKRFTTKLKMSKEHIAETGGRRGSIRQMKSELKHLVSKIRLRNTGLNEVNQHYLFVVLTTILNE